MFKPAPNFAYIKCTLPAQESVLMTGQILAINDVDDYDSKRFKQMELEVGDQVLFHVDRKLKKLHPVWLMPLINFNR